MSHTHIVVTGRSTNKWSAVTIRIAMAIFSRSPAAYRAVKALGVLQLPCDRTLKHYMQRHSTFPGINEDLLFQAAQRYEEFKSDRVHAGFACPIQEGVLIWDEVKVCCRWSRLYTNSN